MYAFVSGSYPASYGNICLYPQTGALQPRASTRLLSLTFRFGYFPSIFQLPPLNRAGGVTVPVVLTSLVPEKSSILKINKYSQNFSLETESKRKFNISSQYDLSGTWQVK